MVKGNGADVTITSNSWAVLSDCGRYRYELGRDLPDWLSPEDRRVLTFILLNPSTADAEHDDPTIRRLKGFAREWGYDKLIVVNLFAYRTRFPSDLKSVKDPVGSDNDRHIRSACRRANRVVAGWGAHGTYMNRCNEVLKLLADCDVRCFGLTHNKQPRHPLYISKVAKPTFRLDHA